jgi:hypothetical protein
MSMSIRSSTKTMEALEREIEPMQRRLLQHPVYREVNTRERLRTFMEIHVFAVWDFMSLAKRLQRELTCVSLPWVPPRCTATARFINEVVLGEESDLGLDGEPTSHLFLYREAMREVGADTGPFDAFLETVTAGGSWREALVESGLPPRARDFVTSTLECALEDSRVEVAAAFLFGREDLIPEMFERLIDIWKSPEEVPHFHYYLRRHIELDGDEHGPLAQKMLTTLLDEEPSRKDDALAAARRALEARHGLWDAVLETIHGGRT